MVMVTLTTGIMFLLFTFGCGEFYEGGASVRRPPIGWSAIAEGLRGTGVQQRKCKLKVRIQLRG
jgi:hypothetical protein